MTHTERSLFAAIRTAPDDDLPRLAAADFFRESGRDALADFVAASLAAGRCRDCPTCRGAGTYFRPLRALPTWSIASNNEYDVKTCPACKPLLDAERAAWGRIEARDLAPDFWATNVPGELVLPARLAANYVTGGPKVFVVVRRGFPATLIVPPLGYATGPRGLRAALTSLAGLPTVTACRVAECEPVRVQGRPTDRYRWWSERGMGSDNSRPWTTCSLPEDVFGRLTRGTNVHLEWNTPFSYDYPSEDLAFEDLTAALGGPHPGVAFEFLFQGRLRDPNPRPDPTGRRAAIHDLRDPNSLLGD